MFTTPATLAAGTARRRGAIALLSVIFLIPLLGVMAITLDLGLSISERRKAQAAADASALAAADVLFQNYRTWQGVDQNNQARNAIITTASANGFAASTSCDVEANVPPQSGIFQGKPGYAEVVIRYRRPAGFASIWNSSGQQITARAVAVGKWGGGELGILVLDPVASQALSSGGGGSLVTNAKVIVNSKDSSAAVTSGGSSLTAPYFDITGGYTGGGFNGVIRTGVPPMPDPLAYLPQPDPSKMPVQSNKKMTVSGGSPTLSPGVYKGGIAVSGQGGLTLQPGIYYMDGGGFSFTGQGSLYAPGVMIFNAPQNSNDIVSIQGSGKGAVYVTPPSTGIYQGISVFQDRNWDTSMNISGNGNFTFLGTFYAAKAYLKISGNSPSNSIGSQYISRLLSLSGSGGVGITWDTNFVARFRTLGLVE